MAHHSPSRESWVSLLSTSPPHTAPLVTVSHFFTSQLFHSTSVLSLDLTVPCLDHSSYTGGFYCSPLTPSNPSTPCLQKS